MSELHHFSERSALDSALAAHIAGRLAADIRRRGSASLAVSGGSTPAGMFAALSRQQLAWEQVWITLVDERWVDPDSPDSNEKLVREQLLQNAAAAANFIGLKGSATEAAAGLAEVSARLDPLPLPLTCAVLGMGGDGHTASWFPRASNLAELLDPQGEALLACSDPVTAPHQRITFTLPAILAAGEIIIHITGEEKRAVLAEASDKGYPIAAISEQQDNPASIWWAP
ncbi:6-phosphogluconolactonase [Seongchinamella sediminis]|uniref:6-phosphogluconolactonase n=1 Tax=Seongchinamella sediminis TaxID=2283635 RepID=A0A3L7E1M6_9GAMM|nr:6-phosphogluconolactonase [Seongchinamella sediminis]RLQ23396.1 6-phosphogluconolactonase [Seongchinamella sediminis]